MSKSKANKAQKGRHYYFFAFAVLFFLFSSIIQICAQDIAEPIWRQSLGGAVTGIPAVQAESAVVVLDSGSIKAFSTGGNALWTYSARGRVSPFVTRSREGTSYIGRTNGILIAVNRSGRELWQVNLGSPLSAPVICGWDGRLFVPTGQKISCYTGAGRRLWQHSLESPISLRPVPDKRGGILMVLENRDLVRIDPFGKMSSFSLREVPLAVLPVDEELLLVYKNGALEITDPAGEAPRTLPPLPSPPLAAVCRLNQGAAVLGNGKVLLFSAQTGEVLWTAESHIRSSGNAATVSVSMTFDERGVYVLSLGGASGFSAYGTDAGSRLWTMNIERAATIPAFGNDGILYSGGSDWLLYAYRMEDPVRQQSLYGPAPEGNYGIAGASSNENYQFDLITKALDSGAVGENELAYTGSLMEFLKNELPRPGIPRLYPQADLRRRIQALQLLGRFGSPEIIPFLADVFTRDNEPRVKAAAAEAMGSIGIDPEGIALRAFSEAIFSPGSLRDEQSLLGIAAASGALCRFGGPPIAERGVKILTGLTAPDRPPAVRLRAQRELELISK
ncbi:hypothetical protein AGMMS49579_11690 [Spirochaetia bacterium]|nr:hypothetical protein AGMMS49579_11690 [Spirochaetia bacterium]